MKNEVHLADAEVEKQIYSYLNLSNPKSFFLYAGAGSGKTRTLVNVLKELKIEREEEYRLTRRKVGVITYTKAARDEIISRLEYEPIFEVSTIHSFAWGLICTLTDDIRKWLTDKIETEVTDLRKLQENRTSMDRQRRIVSKEERIQKLKNTKKFSYSPDSTDEKNSLNHSEVLAITAYMIREKPLMRGIITAKYPIIFVDECQDTNKEMMNALFVLQKEKLGHISIGLFGDTMQRIYTDGLENLAANIPDEWEKPKKYFNYRSKKRIVSLVNKIREDVDNQKQVPYNDQNDGIVRLFISARENSVGKDKIESEVTKRMSKLTGDNLWNSVNGTKMLILEHRMAAIRMGFSDFFNSLYKIDKLKTGLLEGNLPQLQLFIRNIIPLVRAYKAGNKFEIMRIIVKYSPLLQKKTFVESTNQRDSLNSAHNAVRDLCALWDDDNTPRIIDVLISIERTGLFELSDVYKQIISNISDSNILKVVNTDENQEIEEESDAWYTALLSPFSQIENYQEYIFGSTRFGTHHGIKGLEFPRVMVVIDDEEAKGFLFSYDKLFGVKKPSDTDIKNKGEGKDDSIERTKRLFYVVCSRAIESLALVAYTNDPETLQSNVIQYGWFNKEEVEIID